MKRFHAVLALLGLTALLLSGCMTDDEWKALDTINFDRNFRGIHSLSENFTMNAKAQAWADHLASRSGGNCSGATLQHSNLADGAPAGWRMLGENVGCRIAPGNFAQAVGPMEESFMNSPGHRANILNPTFNHGAVAFAAVPASTNNGWMAIYQVQYFATL